jgi:hypothetical protein
VAHRESRLVGSPLRPLGWAPDAPSTRTRDEAYRLATDIARRVRRDPSTFSQLARESSDDATTRDRGGSLGGVHPGNLPARFLDAVAAMRPGQTSEVIETSLGFHVILRRSPPPPEDVAALHVVIGYETTLGDAAGKRSRGDALAVAEHVLDLARAGSDFASLVDRYSEAPDRSRGGDMGVRSTVEADAHATLLEALSQVAVGEVLPGLVDTPFGFQIAKRVAASPRPPLAAHIVRFQFDPAVPEMADRARREAEKLARASAGSPFALERSAAMESLRWIDGRGDPALTDVVEPLHLGETTPAPVRLHDAYALVRRVTPETVCPLAGPTYELPDPGFVDIEVLIRENAPELLTRAMSDLRAAVPAARLPPAESAILADVLARLEPRLAGSHSPEERVAAYRQEVLSLRNRLSEATYALVMDSVNRWVAEEILKQAHV